MSFDVYDGMMSVQHSSVMMSMLQPTSARGNRRIISQTEAEIHHKEERMIFAMNKFHVILSFLISNTNSN